MTLPLPRFEEFDAMRPGEQADILVATAAELVKRAIRLYARAELQRATSSPTKPKKFVYFIQGEDGGPIKIGIANDPEKRLIELQRTSPSRLKILAWTPGDVQDERALHERFAERRLHGEWFEPCDGIFETIELLGETIT